MIDFQSIQTTTDPSQPTSSALSPLNPRMTALFVGRDSMARRHCSRGWTVPAKGKSSHKTSEGDSNSLVRFSHQDTEIEVTRASSA